MFDFINFNWLDFSLIVLVGIIAGLFARRKLAGLVVGIVGILLIPLLLRLGETNVILALIVGVIVSIVLALLGQFLNNKDPFPHGLQHLLGGIGGLLLGLSMLFAIVTALPIDVINNQIIYPSYIGSTGASVAVEEALNSSQFVGIGRDILLYDVYVANNMRDRIVTADPDFVGTMNSYLVAGEPWN